MIKWHGKELSSCNWIQSPMTTKRKKKKKSFAEKMDRAQLRKQSVAVILKDFQRWTC